MYTNDEFNHESNKIQIQTGFSCLGVGFYVVKTIQMWREGVRQRARRKRNATRKGKNKKKFKHKLTKSFSLARVKNINTQQ